MKQKPLAVTINLPIKTYDIDFAGIVSNIVYIRWLEDLRLKMLEFYLPLEGILPNYRFYGNQIQKSFADVRSTYWRNVDV